MKTKKIEVEIRDNAGLSYEELEERMLGLAYKVGKLQKKGSTEESDILEMAKAILEIGDIFKLLDEIR